MAIIPRTHYFIHRKICGKSLIKVVQNYEGCIPSTHLADILIKAICRLYEQEKGGDSNGIVGKAA